MVVAGALDERRRNLFPSEVAHNKEDIRLIWVDENLDDLSYYHHTQLMLFDLNPAVQFYSDFDRCVHLIKSIKEERVFLIISDAFARRVLSQISNRRTLVAVFIFCDNHQLREGLMNKYDKIIDVFTDADRLLQSIRETMDLVEKQILAFSLFDQKQKIGRDLSKESAVYIWYQMLIYVLKQMPPDELAKDEMLKMCRDYYRDSKAELRKIEEFRVSYTDGEAIEWYTNACFLYKLLNKALRTEDIELLYAFRFFIIDLCDALEKERLQLKIMTVVTLYRGTQIPTEELEKLQQNEGQIISINGFLSTTRNMHVSLAFAGQCLQTRDFQAVLFEIEVDPSLTRVIFGDIEHRTHMKGEEEVLFSLNTHFKIGSTTFDSKLSVWKVKLTATDAGSENVQEYLISAKQELYEYTPIIYFGRLLLFELDRTDRAKKYFEMVLQSLPSDHADIPSVYNNIGHVHRRRDDLNLAFRHYEVAYEIRRKRLLPNHPDIASSLYNIGGIYRRKGNFDQALDYYRQAFDIDEKNYLGDHHHKAGTIKNIGLVYAGKGDLYIALIHLFRALNMFKRVLPAQHPRISRCLCCIGYVYEKRGDFNCALDYYHQQLKMEEQCLPPDHLSRSKNLDAIVDIYKKMDETEKALDLCREKLSVQKNTLGEAHPCFAQTLVIMAHLLEDKNLNEALKHYEQAVSILEQATPLDHLALGKCLILLSCLYWRRDMMDDALRFELKALDLNRHTLSSDHIYIANGLKYIGIYYRCTSNPLEALRYFNESLLIYRTNYGPDHEEVKTVQTHIDELNGNLTSAISTERKFSPRTREFSRYWLP